MLIPFPCVTYLFIFSLHTLIMQHLTFELSVTSLLLQCHALAANLFLLPRSSVKVNVIWTENHWLALSYRFVRNYLKPPHYLVIQRVFNQLKKHIFLNLVFRKCYYCRQKSNNFALASSSVSSLPISAQSCEIRSDLGWSLLQIWIFHYPPSGWAWVCSLGFRIYRYLATYTAFLWWACFFEYQATNPKSFGLSFVGRLKLR